MLGEDLFECPRGPARSLQLVLLFGADSLLLRHPGGSNPSLTLPPLDPGLDSKGYTLVHMETATPLRVGEVARGAQVRPDIVRFYRRAGLLGTALAAGVCCS